MSITWQLVEICEPWGSLNSDDTLFIIMTLPDYMHREANSPPYSKTAFSEFGPVRGKWLNCVFILDLLVLWRDLLKLK